MNLQGDQTFQLPTGKNQLRIEVSIRFGNPKYEDCRNFGICKMEKFKKSNLRFYNKKQYAHAIIVKENRDEWILFIKESMSKETINLNFGKRKFLIEQGKVIENEIANRLELNKLILSKGEYLLKETKEHLIIKLTS